MTEMGICNEEQIAYLLAAAMAIQERSVGTHEIEGGEMYPFFWKNEQGERRELRPENFQQTGQMLLDFSEQAYREKHPNAPIGASTGHAFRFTGATINPWVRLEAVEVIKSAHGYELGCQGPGWKGSQARRFIRKLVRLAVWQLPGYHRASLGPPHQLDSLMVLELNPGG